jgi:hypothetical protein
LTKEVAAGHDQHYALLKPSLERVVTAVNEVTASFEKMVDHIIEKYEGGIDVE